MKLTLCICDSPKALIHQEAGLNEGDRVLYRTPGAPAESGDVVRYLVKPLRSPGARLDTFEDKYIFIALIR